MQKLFSMFPAGPPGIALLLLRVSVGVVLFIDQCGRPAWPSATWLLIATCLAMLAVIVGFLTPLFALACGLLRIYALAQQATSLSLAIAPSMSLALLLAAAVAMLGPGAYSLDARMFGRRVVLLPSQR